eukprot:NODE_398_length_2813_cov_14.066543_g342_i0.p1 GENE.NODE_398_length_2813_cov_14.066543_g342_i0~~NODE_398_length_2813_cov_14.066543_g342_i0.p1  ORF type:complete len:467 (-),score=88.86 NODE_398_length_2813_cov_14.066543_g342_i0:77-1477(-)
MVQVENEYGYYGDVTKNTSDRLYIEWLASTFRKHLGDPTLLYTTDSPYAVTRGSLQDSSLYSAIDFGVDSVNEPNLWKQQELSNPYPSPKICMELYAGWMTHWGENMPTRPTALKLAKTISTFLTHQWSFVLYMAHGGTNFGFWAGANANGSVQYQPHTTSYDYQCPLSESGHHTLDIVGHDKYNAVRLTIQQRLGESLPKEPSAPILKSYGVIQMTKCLSLLDNIQYLMEIDSMKVESLNNIWMENWGQRHGLILCSTVVHFAEPGHLRFSQLHDRVQVYLDKKYMGQDNRGLDRGVDIPKTSNSTAMLDLLIEGMGRVNFEQTINYDRKGIGSVSYNGIPMEQLEIREWRVVGLPLSHHRVASLVMGPIKAFQEVNGPVFYSGEFLIHDEPEDTFISSVGWNKGMIWVNEFNLGRYWENAGPQHTLYVPKHVLRKGINKIIMLELMTPVNQFVVHTLDQPLFYS